MAIKLSPPKRMVGTILLYLGLSVLSRVLDK